MSNPFATAESSSMSSTEPLQPMAFSQAGMPGSAAPPMPMGQGGAGQPQRWVLFFHLAFKSAALFTYMFLSGVGLSYMLTFVFVTILSALDFWTVKNVSGRLLVGLRWSNQIDDAGKSTWIFQSFEDQRIINQTDSNIFWLGAPSFLRAMPSSLLSSLLSAQSASVLTPRYGLLPHCLAPRCGLLLRMYPQAYSCPWRRGRC